MYGKHTHTHTHIYIVYQMMYSYQYPHIYIFPHIYINITIKEFKKDKEESQQDKIDPKLHILWGFKKNKITGF